MSKFKVGDRVYCPLLSRMILTVSLWEKSCFLVESKEGHTCFFDDNGLSAAFPVVKDAPQAVLIATHENHALLSQLYPSVEFEKPRLTGSDLTRQKLENGEKYILCWVGDVSDHIATQDKRIQVVTSKGANGCFIDDARENWFFAVPVPRNFYAMDDE